MISTVFHIFILLLASLSLSSCGVKGNLKTPTQIEAQAAKKAQKEEEKKAKEAEVEAKEKLEQK